MAEKAEANFFVDYHRLGIRVGEIILSQISINFTRRGITIQVLGCKILGSKISGIQVPGIRIPTVQPLLFDQR